jgi:hypothetical protein
MTKDERTVRPLSKLRLAVYVALAWLAAMVGAAGLIAPAGHVWILYVMIGLYVGAFSAVIHAVAILLVRGPLPTSIVGTLIAAAVPVVLIVVNAEDDDRSFMKFLVVTALIASQLVHWIVVRPLAKRAANPLGERPSARVEG